jgi:hypothetical protein
LRAFFPGRATALEKPADRFGCKQTGSQLGSLKNQADNLGQSAGSANKLASSIGNVEKRAESALSAVTRLRTKSGGTHSKKNEDGSLTKIKEDLETNLERAEGLQIVREMAQAYIETIDFYKSDWGGKTHDEAVESTIEHSEWRRGAVKGLRPEEVEWKHIAAVAEVSTEESLEFWKRVRAAAENELESGRRSAAIAGDKTDPYALAQFMAIRDSFADQWQPQGGIESAMIDMLTVSYSLQMYWTQIAHQRAIKEHDNQGKDLKRYETKGWKSPYQYEADQ